MVVTYSRIRHRHRSSSRNTDKPRRRTQSSSIRRCSRDGYRKSENSKNDNRRRGLAIFYTATGRENTENCRRHEIVKEI